MVNKNFIITKEQIERIKKLLLQRNVYKQIKNFLDNLEEFEEDTLRNELRRYLMNQGKSDISKKDIWDILDNTKLKSGGKKMTEEETEEKTEDSESEETSEKEDKEVEDSEKKDSDEDKDESSEDSDKEESE